MYEQVEKYKENRSRAVANSVVQKKSGMKQGFGFVDNRPEAVAQRKLKEMLNNSSHVNLLNRSTIQLMPATAVGSTHLVEINNKSIMRGEEGEFVEAGDKLDVNPNTRVISRRGPSQELVADYDERGEHMYRWYEINKVIGGEDLKEGTYIREKTFEFDHEEGEPLKAHNLEGLQDKRTRQSHVAVRFEVWYNTNRDIDPAGHLVMADKSAEFQKIPPYYAYEMGGETSPQGKPNKSPLSLGVQNTNPLLGEKDKQGLHSSVSVDDARTVGARVPGGFKTLDQLRESQEKIQDRLRSKKKYPSAVDKGKWFNATTASHMEKPELANRFDEKKWIEILLTIDEYRNLMSMWEGRKKDGFYCFVREARTKIGYEYATRCLSSLEDVAILRKQNDLEAGHAKDILDQFQRLNNITDKHIGTDQL